MVDTNSDPNIIEFPIPANDDASKSILLIIDKVCEAISEGLEERKMEREKEGASKDIQDSEEEEVMTIKKSAAKKAKDYNDNMADSDNEDTDEETIEGDSEEPEDNKSRDYSRAKVSSDDERGDDSI